jgi:hypothetical protein
MTHGQLNLCSLHAIRGDHDTTVLADFAVVASSASDDDIDICLFSSMAGKVDI